MPPQPPPFFVGALVTWLAPDGARRFGWLLAGVGTRVTEVAPTTGGRATVPTLAIEPADTMPEARP